MPVIARDTSLAICERPSLSQYQHELQPVGNLLDLPPRTHSDLQRVRRQISVNCLTQSVTLALTHDSPPFQLSSVMNVMFSLQDNL
eukprot:6176028-Pleurochrysis_carterae.AAC.4